MPPFPTATEFFSAEKQKRNKRIKRNKNSSNNSRGCAKWGKTQKHKNSSRFASVSFIYKEQNIKKLNFGLVDFEFFRGKTMETQARFSTPFFGRSSQKRTFFSHFTSKSEKIDENSAFNSLKVEKSTEVFHKLGKSVSSRRCFTTFQALPLARYPKVFHSSELDHG